MTRNEELAMARVCLRDHLERLAEPGVCFFCDNAHRYEENERVKKASVVNAQGTLL